MSQSKKEFRHELLQDVDSIQDIVKAIADGLAKGKLNFSDEDGEIKFEPEGLLNLKVTASQESNKHRFAIRVSWQVEDVTDRNKKSLNVKS